MRKRVALASVLLLLNAFVCSADSDWRKVVLESPSIADIVPDRQDDRLWFLMTAKSKFSVYGELYRSTDRGKTWRKSPIPPYVKQVLVHPSTRQVFAVTSKKDFESDIAWISSNHGTSFKPYPARGGRLEKIFLDPNNSQVLYASGISEWGLAVSRDQGRTWRPITSLPYRPGAKLAKNKSCRVAGYTFTDLLVAAWDSKTLYANAFIGYSCGQNDYYEDVLLLTSNNGGGRWHILEQNEDYKDYRFHADPLFPNRAFVFKADSLRKITAGGIESPKKPGADRVVSVSGEPNALIGFRVSILDGSRQLVRTNNLGQTWRRLDFDLKARIRTIQTMQTGGALVGTDNVGLFRRTRGESWKIANKGIAEAQVRQVAYLPESSTLFAGVIGVEDTFYPSSLYQTKFPNLDWKNLTLSIPRNFTNGYGFEGPFAVNPKNPKNIIIDGVATLVTIDGGKNWHRIGGRKMNGPFFDPLKPKVVYFSKGRQVYRSDNYGLQLKALNLAFSKEVSRVVVDPNDSKTLYCFTGSGIYKSTDGGKTAGNINTEITHLRDVVPLGVSGGYIGYDRGPVVIYRTLDGMQHWEVITAKRLNWIEKLVSVDSTGNHLLSVNWNLLESKDAGRTWKNISGELGREFVGPHRRGFINDITDPNQRPLFVGTTLGIYRRAQ